MNAIALLLSAWMFAPAEDVTIVLEVKEPVGVARENAPVCGGVCLPAGRFDPSIPFSLWEGDREVPVQVSPLVIDHAGQLRWILVDFQTSLPARGEKTLTLRPIHPRVTCSQPLRFSEDERIVSINTGPLIVEINKREAFSLFSKVFVHNRLVVDGGGLDWIDGQSGVRYCAGPPSRIDWEYRGPLRATLRVQGCYDGPGDARTQYITRLTFWSGRTDVRIQHIFANSNEEQVYHIKVRRASLYFRHLLDDEAEIHLAGAPAPRRLKEVSVGWIHQGKLPTWSGQQISDAAQAGYGEEILWKGMENPGWLAITSRTGSIWVCDRDFIGDPPRKISVDSEKITVDFIANKLPGERGQPFVSDALWLYDLSHRTAEVWVDFGPPPRDGQGPVEQGAGLQPQETWNRRALGVRERLLAFAPPEWYSACDVFGVGFFGTLADEIAVYQQWGWEFSPNQLPRSLPAPKAFIRWEDNHYESEADSPEALLLMALRTGQRGFFDLAEAWARYHANMHAWRSDGWVFDDGAIWFPQGGPLGTKPVREPPNVEYKKWGQGTPDDQELWHLVQAKACYCHFYGAGLIDMFLITGERDYLEAAIDLAEQKRSEFLKHRQLTPGKTTIDDTRGFGRGFYVLTHLAEVNPDIPWLNDLIRRCRDVLWECPNMDERGFAPCHIGTGFGGFDLKRDLPPQMKAFMDAQGIAIDPQGWLSDPQGRRWPVVCLGGTWQHFYVQAAAERYARVFQDEDLADFTIAFGRFAARYLLSEKCKQTHYYAYMDIPEKGRPWDPWEFVPPHTETTNGEGCEHSGWYTRFFPDTMAKAYTLTGERWLLERAREFWHYGSKRGYRTLHLSTDWQHVGAFANHIPPKDDTVLSTARMFYEWAHPRRDTLAPEPVRDLTVNLIRGTDVEIRFTAPKDADGGSVARYQLKWALLPIIDDKDYDFSRDDKVKRSFWRASNVSGEPTPNRPGTSERFVVTLPGQALSSRRLYFALVSYDQSGNRSPLSNVAEVKLSEP